MPNENYNNIHKGENAPSSARDVNAHVHAYGMRQGGRNSATPESGNFASSVQAQQANMRYPQQRQQHSQVTQRQHSQTVNQNKQKKKRPVSFWIAIALALIALVLACFFALSMCGDGSGLRDPNQTAGQLEGKTEEEIQAELDRQVEEGMFNISIASVAEFADGTSEGELRIENVPNNRYLMRVEITLDDTGEVIYTTGIIEPNHHIQKARLDKDLPAGTYSCTATFFALDPETEEELGQAAAKITINVLN